MHLLFKNLYHNQDICCSSDGILIFFIIGDGSRKRKILSFGKSFPFDEKVIHAHDLQSKGTKKIESTFVIKYLLESLLESEFSLEGLKK